MKYFLIERFYRSVRVVLLTALIFVGIYTGEVSGEFYQFDRLWPLLPQPWYFHYPAGIAVDGAGNVYVADSGNNRIQKFDSSGTYLTQWGTSGTGNGQFNSPFGVAVDTQGNVYVVDTGNYRIQKFNSSGGYLTQWGSLGTGNGQFNSPAKVAADSSGNIYVADSGNNRIQKFDSSGTYLAQWGSLGNGNGQFASPSGVAVDASDNVFVTDINNHRIQKFNSSGVYLTQWGTSGNGNGQFDGPFGVAVDTPGNIYVADSGNNRIQKFDSGGTYLTQWVSLGTGNGEFDHPAEVAVDTSGNVYVADSGNNRIQKFDSGGTYLAQWGSLGTGNGEFDNPYGVAVDTSGNVYVADTYNHRIQKFDSSGVYLTQWGTYGSGNGQFIYPPGVAVDTSGNIYVADVNNNRIQKFDSNGTYLTQWGTFGFGSGQFYDPFGVAVDASGSVYVADSDNRRIQKFDSSGTYLTQWGLLGTGNGQFNYPTRVAVDTSGNVYVADTYNNRIQKFNSSAAYLTQWGTSGAGEGQFYVPYGVAADASGNVYVADTYNNRIQKFLLKFTITVNSSGDGFGSVTSNVGGISYTYPATNTGTSTPLDPGQSVTITASADAGSYATWDDCVGGIVSGNGTSTAICTYSSLGSDKTPAVTFTIATVPGAPTNVLATPGDTQAFVSFSQPASDGGSQITGYTVTSNPPGGVDSNAGSTLTTHIVTGLTNGTAYTFTVTATNAVGTGPPSSPSNSVTPAKVPGAPTGVAATTGNAQATIIFAPPASDGGSPITGYTVTSNPPGGVDGNAGSTLTTHIVTGLTNGAAYTFTVTATNAVGTGAVSNPSNSVTPTAALVKTFDSSDSIVVGTYSTIQSAFDDPSISSGDIIKVQVATFYESLNFHNSGVLGAVSLKGGYTPEFTSQNGSTAIIGSLTITGGTLTVDRIVIATTGVHEITPPTGSIQINGGAAVTKSATVTLTLTASDDSPPIQMCISNTTSCTSWAALAPTKSWTLTTGNGMKIVYVRFRDTWGNTTPTPYSASILLDTTAPTNGAVTATAGAGKITLNWNGFSDAGSGIGGYNVVFATGSAPTTCSIGTVVPGYDGTSTTYIHTGLTYGTTYGYRVYAIDKAGNSSTGAIASAKAVPEITPPKGSIQINGGATVTKSATVTLTLTASDSSPPIQMCISNTTSCTSWATFAPTKSWTLTTGNGTKTVFVWFRDTWGNTTPAPYSASILLDTTHPVAGIWVGRFTSNVVQSTYDIIGVIAESDAARFFNTSWGAQYSGVVTANGNTFSSAATAYAPFGYVFPDGSHVGPVSISGTFTPQGFMSGTYSGVGDLGTFSLNYSALYERPSSLAAVAGQWRGTVLGYINTVTVDSSGTVTGSSTAGCAYSGHISIINSLYNAYGVNLNITNCGVQNGSYSGLAVLADTYTASDTILVSVSTSSYSFVASLARQ